MGPSPLLAIYFAPAVLVLLNMIRTRSFSLHHISNIWRLPRRITLDDWHVIYGYLGVRFEGRNQPPRMKPERPWRLLGSGVTFATSLFLFQATLPLNIPLSFAQHDWNAFPLIQVAVAGGVLASSLRLAFHRTKGWHLISRPGAEYPYFEWNVLRRKQAKEEGKMT